MTTVHDTHFAEFTRIAQPYSGWTGAIPARWALALPNYAGGSLPAGRLTRQVLRTFCSDAANSAEACFVACMAWGGMNRAHGRDAWSERSKWVPIVEQMRAGGLCRAEAYQRFDAAAVTGLGPAYFTKLIFFARPEADGFILDQWTGKSVSLLFTAPIVTITAAGWVTRMNDALVYQRYCEAIEHLAATLGVTGEVLEEMMFSRGGRVKHPWRQYVLTNWAA